MVAVPIAAVRNDGLASGQASFRQLLIASETRYGRDSVQAADLVEAFGVELNDLGFEGDNEAATKASLSYLSEGISRYRRALAPEHPMVAVALHTWAEADIAAEYGRLSPAAEAALEEALRIRQAALGPSNIETRATEQALMHARLDDKVARSEPLSCRRLLTMGEANPSRKSLQAECRKWESER